MSAPHSLNYDVMFNGNKISEFNLDVDLDNPIEVLEEISKLFKTDSSWFDAQILFRFSEHIYYTASKADFIILNKWYNSCIGELRLVLTECKDWG